MKELFRDDATSDSARSILDAAIDSARTDPVGPSY